MNSRNSNVKKKPSNEKNLGLAAKPSCERPTMGDLQTFSQGTGAALHPTGSPTARLPIQPSKNSAPKRGTSPAPSSKPTSAGERITPRKKPATKKMEHPTTTATTTSPPAVQERPPTGVEATKTITEDPAEEEEEAEAEGTKERAIL